jgi:hypothetical protein
VGDHLRILLGVVVLFLFGVAMGERGDEEYRPKDWLSFCSNALMHEMAFVHCSYVLLARREQPAPFA